MFYEDLFDLAEEIEYKDSNPYKYDDRFSRARLVGDEKKFFCIYSALTDCHIIVVDNKIYDYKLHDIKKLNHNEIILEISNSNIKHSFTVGSIVDAKIKDHSLELLDSNKKCIEIIPTQLRSMINNFKIL